MTSMLHGSRNNRHFSAEDLARYAEGDLRVRKISRISAHLEVCLRCQGVRASLTTVSETLASVKAPPMPAYLSIRIETALSVEAANRVAGEPASAEASRRDLPVRSRRSAWRRIPGAHSPLGLRLAAGAAAAILVAGVSYEAIDHLGGSHGPASTASNGVSRPNLGVEFGPSVSYHHHGALSLVQPIHTDTNFQPAQLDSQVHQALTESRAPAPEVSHGTNAPEFHSASGTTAAPKATTNEPAAGAVASPRNLSACVGAVSAGDLVILVDVASYRGHAAIIIVTAVTSTAKSGVVWVLGLGCTSTDHHLLARRHINL